MSEVTNAMKKYDAPTIHIINMTSNERIGDCSELVIVGPRAIIPNVGKALDEEECKFTYPNLS